MSRRQLVIDASAALHVALAAEPTPALLDYDLVAPAVILSERTSSLATAAFRAGIPAAAVPDAFDRLEAMPIMIVGSEAAHRRAALELARSVGWAKSYDAEYVVLAQRLGCGLLTTDARLMRVAGHLVEVIDPSVLG
ncbi:MAG: type II toxin-antitoxin system VapC family toxin [Candidatus Limnocylindria bacterium]